VPVGLSAGRRAALAAAQVVALEQISRSSSCSSPQALRGNADADTLLSWPPSLSKHGSRSSEVVISDLGFAAKIEASASTDFPSFEHHSGPSHSTVLVGGARTSDFLMRAARVAEAASHSEFQMEPSHNALSLEASEAPAALCTDFSSKIWKKRTRAAEVAPGLQVVVEVSLDETPRSQCPSVNEAESPALSERRGLRDSWTPSLSDSWPSPLYGSPLQGDTTAGTWAPSMSAVGEEVPHFPVGPCGASALGAADRWQCQRSVK